jgi:hypothetical protein
METFLRRVAGDGNTLFRNHAILLKNVSYYFVLRDLIADADTVLCYVEYITKSVKIQQVFTQVQR